MKNIIKALGGFGVTAIIFATGYFILLYKDLTQLIIALGIVGLVILAALVYIYNWMKNKDESDKENKEKHKKDFGGLEQSINLVRDYVREVEKKIK